VVCSRWLGAVAVEAAEPVEVVAAGLAVAASPAAAAVAAAAASRGAVAASAEPRRSLRRIGNGRFPWPGSTIDPANSLRNSAFAVAVERIFNQREKCWRASQCGPITYVPAIQPPP
jgi:hypothetical protein